MNPENPGGQEWGGTGQSDGHQAHKPSDARQCVILVAEDNPLFRRLVTALMSREGYFVLSAADGQEALETSRLYPGSIDLLITDVQMPRMNGIELCTRLFQERPAVKVIFVTGVGLGEFATFDADVPVLSKPIDGEFLTRKVRAALAPTLLSTDSISPLKHPGLNCSHGC